MTNSKSPPPGDIEPQCKIFSEDSVLGFLNPYIPHLAMAYVMFCFAGYTCMGRHLKGEGPMFEPLVFLLIRHWGSAILMTIYVFCKEKIIVPKRKERFRIFLCGSLGISGTHLLFIYGLRATTATSAACLEPLIPCVVFVMALCFGFESVINSWNFYLKILGVILGCGGAILTTLGHARSHIHVTGVGSLNRLGLKKIRHLVGDGAIFLQCFTLGMYILLIKAFVKKYSPMWLTAMILISGALFTSFVTLLSLLGVGGEWPGWSTWHIHETFWLETAYATIIASIQNYALRTWAMQYMKSTTVSMYFCLDPPATALLAYLYLSEEIHLNQIIGAVLILTGMYMTIHFGEKIVAPPTPSTPSKRRRRSSSERRGSSPMVFAPYRDADDGMEDQPLMHPYVDDDDTEEVDMYGSDEW
eukprot:g258.t1